MDRDNGLPDHCFKTPEEEAFYWGRLVQEVRHLREEVTHLTKSTSKRCTDCAQPARIKDLAADIKNIRERLSKVELRMAAIAAVMVALGQFATYVFRHMTVGP